MQEAVTTVRMHNTNTGKILRMAVQCADGVPRVEGDCEVDGVPGRGAESRLQHIASMVSEYLGQYLPGKKCLDQITT